MLHSTSTIVASPRIHAATFSSPTDCASRQACTSVVASVLAPIAAQGASVMASVLAPIAAQGPFPTLPTPRAMNTQTQNKAGAEVLFLHGFGATQPELTVPACMVKRAVDGFGARFHCPCYHPGGDYKKTRIGQFLAQLRSMALSLPSGRFSVIVGYSVGGLIAALFQEQFPELVGSIVLIAPSIDNYERNYRHVPSVLRAMPAEYVEEMAQLSARPVIKVPAAILHGMLDIDGGVDMPARVKQWTSQAKFEKCYFPETLNHSLEPWISSESPGLLGIPSLKEIITWALQVGQTQITVFV